MLERLLEVKEGIHIPYNTINAILRSAGLTKLVKMRGKRKVYVRWERKHSLSLWQTDWTQFEGKWLIIFIDDASRLIVSWGLFEHATSENSVKTLKDAIVKHGKPKSILTGRDIQFYASDKMGKPSGKVYFQEFLEANGIRHILEDKPSINLWQNRM